MVDTDRTVSRRT